MTYGIGCKVMIESSRVADVGPVKSNSPVSNRKVNLKLSFKRAEIKFKSWWTLHSNTFMKVHQQKN